MTLPTQLTLLRILLAFFVMGLLFLPGWPAKTAALLGFLAAGATDWLDGYLARRLGQATPLGALLDPIADKVLVLGIFLAFVQLRLIPAWMVLIIVLRESLITGVRLVAANRHVVLPAAKEGKQKTISQMLTIAVILAVMVFQELPVSHTLPLQMQEAIRVGVFACLWVTMVLTVVSGTMFFWRHRTILRDVVSP